MPWYFYALLSALFFATQDLLMRVLAIKTNNPRSFSFVFNTYGAFFAFIAFIFQNRSLSSLPNITPINIVLIFFTVSLYGLYERLNFAARKSVNASSLSIIYKLSMVIAFIGSIVLLQETLTIEKILGTTCIISASILLLYKNAHLIKSRSLSIPFLCAIFLGAAWVMDKPASANMNPSLYSFIVWVGGIIFIVLPKISFKDIKTEFILGGWQVALTAILNVLGFICYLYAFTLADASRVIPIVSISGIVTVLGGILLLKEHDHIYRKIIAAIIAFVGVYLLR